MIRYAFMNPVREGLARDPWGWPWSTLRDLGGAVVHPWTDLESVAAFLDLSPRYVLVRLTETADLHVDPPRRETTGFASAGRIKHAVAAALRVPADVALERPLGRRLAVQAAACVGEVSASRIARELALNPRTVRRLVASPPHSGLASVQLCLSDARLVGPMPRR
jgi:hypothetical protein